MSLEHLLEQTRAKRDAKDLHEFQIWIRKRAIALVEAIGLDIARELNIRFQLDRRAVFQHADRQFEFKWAWRAGEYYLSVKHGWSERDVNSVEDLLDALVKLEQNPIEREPSREDAEIFPTREDQAGGLSLLEFFTAINLVNLPIDLAIEEAKRSIDLLRPTRQEPEPKWFTLDEVLSFGDPLAELQPDQQPDPPYDNIPF